MANTAGTAKSNDDNTWWGCGFLVAVVVVGTLGAVLFHVVDTETSLLVCATIVLCCAMLCVSYYRVARLRLEDARNQRLLDENRADADRQQQLELARLAHELELARLKAQPSAQKQA